MDPTHAKGSSRPKMSASSEDAARRPEDAPADQNPRNAVLLAESTQKLGSVEKAMEVYALFSANLMTSAIAAPPPMIREDLRAQTAVPHDKEPQSSTRAPDSGFQQSETAPSTSTPEAEIEKATGELAADGGLRDGSETVEPEGREIGNPNFEGRQVGETPPVYIEGGTPFTFVVGDTPGLVVEGKTPVLEEVVEGETHGERNTVGETPDEAGDETPRNFRGETPEPTEEEILEETPNKTEVQEDQEEEEPLVDKRAERRRTRRSLFDEVDDFVYFKEEEFPARGAVGGQEETPGSGNEAEESRLAKERKRKGKRAHRGLGDQGIAGGDEEVR